METQSYNNFWRRIHQSAKNKGFPLRVMFELTYQCNFNCRHCYVPQSYRRKKGGLKTKGVFSILDQLKDIGCFYLGFTGGELFLREDIIQILWYAKRKGFEIIIYTNGSLINEKIADELAALRPNKVDITIPAMEKVAFKKITQAHGSQKKVFKAIKLLHERRVELGFKTCVLRENESEIKEIQDFAASLGALHRLDDSPSPCLDGSKEPFKYRGSLHVAYRAPYIPSQTVNNCDSEKYNLKTKDHRPSTIEYRVSSMNLFKCGVGIAQAAITPFGELKMCLMIDYPKYKILETSLKDCWLRLKRLVSSIKPDKKYKCDRCELEPYCKWCPARAWLYNGTFTSCEPESRKRAKQAAS